jgi:hypothetical protein
MDTHLARRDGHRTACRRNKTDCRFGRLVEVLLGLQLVRLGLVLRRLPQDGKRLRESDELAMQQVMGDRQSG